MSEFHYVRTRGDDGGVDACEGPAIGLDLGTVLRDGLPPWNVALEIVAALCEILDIADQDGEVHGEVHPRYVFIDETGAVSLEGFGIKRRKCRAPEGIPKETRSDLYGLGYVAYRCFCSHTLPETVPTDPSAHDDLIVDAALELDLSGISPAMQGDIQWYVAKLMDFEPAQRPAALDSWRTFIAFANATEGVNMADWCAAALDGGGARRREAQSDKPTANKKIEEDEDLGGPVLVRGGITARVAFDEPGGASGGSKGATAFWSKEDMKRALDETPETPVRLGETPARGVRPITGAATSFWSQSQLDAIARGDDNAPRPRRIEGEGERRRVTAAQRPPSAARPEPRPAPSRSSAGAMGPASVYNIPSNKLPTTAGIPAPNTSRPPAPPSTTFQPSPVARSGGATATADAPSAPTAANPAPQAPTAHPAPHQAPTQRFDVTPEEKAQMVAAAKAQHSQQAQSFQKPPSPTTGPLQQGLGLNPVPKRSEPPVPERPLPPKVAPHDPPAEQDAGNRGGLTFVLFSGGLAAVGVAVVSVLLVLCMIVLAVVFWPDPKSDPVPLPIQPLPVRVDPAPAPVEPVDPAPVEPAPPTTPKPINPKPIPPKPTTPKPATPKPVEPKPVPVAPQPQPVRPQPAKPVPSGSSARVTIQSSGRGAVTACVSSKESFEGKTSFEIDGYLLPATCLVKIDGAQGVFQVYGTGSITCDKQGTVVLCDKQQVP